MTETSEREHAERLDRALWLWAEEKWRREQLLAQREQWWESVARQRHQVEAERDALKARIDAGLAAIGGGTEFGLTKPGALHAVRAALLGDQLEVPRG